MDVLTENVGDTKTEDNSATFGDMTESNTVDTESSQINSGVEGSKEVEKETETGDSDTKLDATEEHSDDSPEEMINLPDTFFDDLMDVEFLGSFDVVDSWKQDEDNADGKSEGKSSEEKGKVKSSESDAKGRRTRDNDRSRSDKYDSRRTRSNYRDNKQRDWRDRDGKNQQKTRSRSERSRSRSKKGNLPRSRRDRSRSRSRKRSSSRQRKDRSNSKSRKDRSNSKSRKDRSNSKSRKERRSNSRSRNERKGNSRSRNERRSNSKSRNERSNSKSRNVRRSNSRSRNVRRSNSRSRNERRSNSKSRNEIGSNSRSKNERRSNSRSRNERRSISRSRRDRSGSRSRKESSMSVRQENNDNIKTNATKIEENGALQDMQKGEYFDAKNQDEESNRSKYNLHVNDESCLPSLQVSTEPAPPGLEEDLVPPGEEPILIKLNQETAEKDANDNKQNMAEKINNKENYQADKDLPVNKQEKQSEDKNEPVSPAENREREYVKTNSVIDDKQRIMKTGREIDELPKNRERQWERSNAEFNAVSKRDSLLPDGAMNRKRSDVDIDPRYSRSHRTRSVSAERDRVRHRENSIETDASIERDIRHFKWLRMLEKREKECADRDPEKASRMRDFRERDDYYSNKQRHRSRSQSPRLSSSPVRSRFAYSRSRSRSRTRSRDYRRRRSSHRSSDSLRSLSLSLSSSDSGTRKRKHSRVSPRRRRRSSSSKRKPFYEEIARKLGIQTNSSEQVYPHRYLRPGGMQQPNIPYTGGLPHHPTPALPMPGYPVPSGSVVGPPLRPVAGPPLRPVAGGPPNLHHPPPNIHVPPPSHHMMQGPPPVIAGLQPPQTGPPPVSYPQPQFMGGPGLGPGPMPEPVVGPSSQSLITITPQPYGSAPPEPIFSVQSETVDPSSLSSYLEATMKGDDKVLQQQSSDKIIQKAGEDKKLLSCVKPEVVTRCEEAVAAVRAENALSMVPLGRVIVQPKAQGTSSSCSTDQVSCFRSPLFDLSNPSFTFTTPPLHDFVSSNLKTAARKLRRSEQVKQLASRSARSSSSTTTPGSKPGEVTRRPGVSVGVNTNISCNSSEWCCKCQAYNLSTAVASNVSSNERKMGHNSQHATSNQQHSSSLRGHTVPISENSDDSDVQIIGTEDDVAATVPSNAPKGILKRDNKPPEKSVHGRPSRNLPNTAVTKAPIHCFSSFANLTPALRSMTPGQLKNFCEGFSLSQRKFLESFPNSNR